MKKILLNPVHLLRNKNLLWLLLSTVLILFAFNLPAEEGHKEDDHTEAGHEESEEGHVVLSAEQLKASGIELVQVGAGHIRETLPLYGSIVTNADKVQAIRARFPGVIRRVNKQAGDSVRQNETLATIESNDSLQTYNVVSAINGVITQRHASSGNQTTDEPLFEIADLATVWVDMALFPRDVGKVKPGQAVRIRNDDSHLSNDGKVIYVASTVDASSQTITARVLLDNSARRWTPGLFVSADVTLTETSVPLVVRNDAIQNHEGQSVVFVQGEEGFEPRPLQLGRSDGDLTEVVQGLIAGETYASKNSFVIKSELGKEGAEHGH